ncbi:MAG: hypothetical protein HY221_01325 [Candidatus Sungbacteria bacterium]|uniref:Amino acid permease n=1 Tax=Candidatus Sungiibacteriota bacterium TaxID=2750080 RepID=A0A932QY36_9BACT|nr:hypothetical protein [Candidatus Sungbacteria bacterium]
MRRFWKAVSVLAGMIIGAGMFAIPFAFTQTGFWLGASQLALLAGITLLLHLLYGEIVLATPAFHRMPGYMRIYLGRGAEIVSWASSLFGIAGTLLAYLVIGSLFSQSAIAAIIPGADIFWIALLLTCAVAFITFFPLKKEAGINGVLTIFEIAFIAAVSLLLMPKISLTHLAGFHPGNLFVPYGVLLFALSGASVIPDLVTVLGRDKKKVRAAIVAGSLIPVVLYFLFALAVVGVTGSATSEEAISGLAGAVGGRMVLLASVAGFLAVLTSFIALSANFQAMLSLDLGMRRRVSWLAASTLPFVLYLAGFQNFIATISAVGVLAFGIDAILFLLVGLRMRKGRPSRGGIPLFLIYAVFLIIAGGVLVQLVRMVW